MGAPRQHVTDDPEVWLGVQEASVMLGVSTATLRRWSAAGKVRAFTTPGGHRRFAESTIRQLLGGAVEPGPSALRLGESSDRIAARFRAHLATMCAGMPWLTSVPTELRQSLAHAETALVDGLLGYLEAHPARDAEASIRPALDAAALHGRVAASHRGDLGQALAAFHRFRGLLVDDLAGLACRQGLPTADATRLLARADDGVDRLTVALVEAYAGAA